jgi:phosphate starvation-inducible protein PhoH and related proteins
MARQHKAVSGEKVKLSTQEHQVIHPRGNQKLYLNSIYQNVITIVYGPPGTGKSLIALYAGFRLMAKGAIEKIYYIKPDVGMYGQRSRGFLPGNALEKAWPLIGPVLDNLAQFMPREQAMYHLEKGTVEVLLLEDLRGRSFDNALVFLDEAQNTLPPHIKTFLTRVGEGSHFVVAGDTYQSDQRPELAGRNGLSDVIYRLHDLEDVGVIEFTREDIQRHPIIAHVLERFDD